MDTSAWVVAVQRVGRWLSGKKTYLGLIATGTLGLLWSSGLISDATLATLGSIVVPLTGVALRRGIQKSEQAAEQLTPQAMDKTLAAIIEASQEAKANGPGNNGQKAAQEN